ncbi:phage tail length tape measure family protein [Bosea lupini]|uniref:phage tail length tape measure family protein n=1 Tax=Bosea lupini TaxID=1036779 RepID=UPI00142F8901|nr:phage tail length tape measure family protein [Bosea lupini]
MTVDARGAEAGTALYIRQMEAAQSASDRVLQAERKAAEARERGTLIAMKQGDSISAISRRWTSLAASIDPAARATLAIERAQLRADAAFRAGIATEAEAARVVDLVRQKHDLAARAVNDNSAAQGNLVRSSGLARHELINLSRQAQDVVVSLSSGQDAMTVLMQQGSQVADVFASSEGTVGGFFRQLGGWLVRIAPWALAATAAMTALYSAISVAGERRQLDTSLLGSGRGVGLTGGQFDQLAKASADTAQITVSNARQIAAEYAKLGQLAATQLPQLTRLTKDYALITGQGMTDAARELATAFADPSRGAEQLAGKVGALDSVTVRSIRTAEMYGDRLRAQKLLIDGLAQSMDGAANAQSKWDRFIEQYWSRPIDRAKNFIGDAVIGPDTAEKVAALDRQIRDLRASAANALPGPEALGINRALGDLEQRKAALEGELKVTQDLAKARAEAAEANRKVAGAEATSREVRPFVAEMEKLQADSSRLKQGYEQAAAAAEKLLLTKPADSPEWWTATKQAADLKASYEAVTRQLQEYKEAQAAGSIEADKAARAQEIQKRYLGQVSAESKAALAAELALNDARGSTMTATERQASAERARVDAIIQTTRAQEDAKRASNDNVSSLEAQARAAKSTGSEFAEAARLRKEAEQFAERNGGNAEEVYQRRLAERLAEVNKELAVKTAQTRESAAIENAVNGRSGNLSETERAQLLQRQNALMQERQRLLAAGATDQAAVNAQLNEYGRALDSAVSAQTRARAQGMLFGQREQIAALEQEVALIWQSADVRERLIAVMRAEQELKRQGIPLTSAEGQAYVANAATIAGLNTVKDSLVDIQSLGRDALKGLIGDLRAGKSGAEALQNALSRVLDKMLDMALNSLFGAKGGFNFSSLFAGWGSSGGSSQYTTDSAAAVKFATGGYTGAGGKYEPAGVVHRGEYVFSKAATDYLGVGNLESLHRRGMRGYADGGHVGMPANSNAPAAANSNRSTRVNVQIINETGGQVEGEAEQTQNPDGSIDTVVRLVESRMGQRAGRGQGGLSGALRARQANKHLQG